MENVKIITNNYVEVPIGRLVKADWNYKEEDAEKSVKLENNIKRNGQLENIIVRELPTGFYEVVNGNHRYDAMFKLGFEKVVCYNLGNISLAHAQRIAIETNETRFQTNDVKLAELFKEISIEFPIEDLSVTMPYSALEIEAFSKMLDFDWNKYQSDLHETDPQEVERLSDDDFDGERNLKFTLTADSAVKWDLAKQIGIKYYPKLNDQKLFEMLLDYYINRNQ